MSQALDSERVLRAISARPARCQPRQELCGWRCERLLGEGALTRVYAAQAPDGIAGQPAPYALKLLRDPWMGDTRAMAVLRREAWIGEHVSHPHLAPTLAARTVDSPAFLVQPLLRGRSLASLLAAGQAPPLPLALWIARQAAEALAALDDAGWMHADIKPSSLFISPESHLTLLDLGAAQKSGEPARLGERPVLGPTRYMAPEMFSATARVDIRVDIYSLGAVLMETLVGQASQDEFGRQKLARTPECSRRRV